MGHSSATLLPSHDFRQSGDSPDSFRTICCTAVVPGFYSVRTYVKRRTCRRKTVTFCAAAPFLIILSKCGIITLDALGNIHTVLSIANTSDGTKGWKRRRATGVSEGDQRSASRPAMLPIWTLRPCGAAGGRGVTASKPLPPPPPPLECTRTTGLQSAGRGYERRRPRSQSVDGRVMSPHHRH